MTNAGGSFFSRWSKVIRDMPLRPDDARRLRQAVVDSSEHAYDIEPGPDWPPSPQTVRLFVRRIGETEWMPIWAAQLNQFGNRPGYELKAEETTDGRWCATGTVLIPASIEEAKMMNLVSERYLKDWYDPSAPAETQKG